MHRRITFCVLSIAAFLSAAIAASSDAGDWKVPAREAQKKNPLSVSDPYSVAVGKETYQHECMACHGEAGRGDGPAAAHMDPKPADLTTGRIAAQTDGALAWKIGTGHPPMPSFKAIVSEDGRWHVVCYLRTLAQPSRESATQASTQPAPAP